MIAIEEADLAVDLPAGEAWRQLAERHPGDALLQAVATVEMLEDPQEPLEGKARTRAKERLGDYLEDATADGHADACAVVEGYLSERTELARRKYDEVRVGLLARMKG